MPLTKSERASLLGQALVPQLNSAIRPGEEPSPADAARQQSAVDQLAADIVETWDADSSDPLYEKSIPDHGAWFLSPPTKRIKTHGGEA